MSHLTLSERVLIENALRTRKGFKEIARLIGRSHTTVKREVVKHAQASEKGAKGRVTNRCQHRSLCQRQYVCKHCEHPLSNRHCASCSVCNSSCSQFEELICARLARPPYVCNGCTKEVKGKSSLMIFDRHANLKYKYGNRHFWCRGYYVNTAGADTRAIAAYIQNQLADDRAMEQLTFREYIDPFTGSKTK